jgi:hypothetical protein
MFCLSKLDYSNFDELYRLDKDVGHLLFLLSCSGVALNRCSQFLFKAKVQERIIYSILIQNISSSYFLPVLFFLMPSDSFH